MDPSETTTMDQPDECYICEHTMDRHIGDGCTGTDESDNQPCRCKVLNLTDEEN